jgi:hypothetical protein
MVCRRHDFRPEISPHIYNRSNLFINLLEVYNIYHMYLQYSYVTTKQLQIYTSYNILLFDIYLVCMHIMHEYGT